ncbi:hypothetical protein [Frigoriglobus tundricola]|uniref:Uncharacterized protein n=1 Tax=Frigoriglobus tundricola TaxID=2774151 RepID=A0A6M5YHX0_9BACT|nr:hypothetical protein [Frigoriglobus tundricola]QJW93134.1 hypothetical protein FTUN_0637 [Frigoriglobus tundricola]
MSRAALSWLVTLTTVPALAADPKAVEPVASFALVDGWVDFTLERDGKPVADARATVLVGAERWASGETGGTGRGTFPRPPGTNCQVVFDLGAGPSAPVPLTFLSNDSVIPTRAPVRDGTAECCVTPPRRPQPTEPQPPERSTPLTPLRDRLIIGAAAVAVNGIWLTWALRRTRRDDSQPSKKRRTQRERG